MELTFYHALIHPNRSCIIIIVYNISLLLFKILGLMLLLTYTLLSSSQDYMVGITSKNKYE